MTESEQAFPKPSLFDIWRTSKKELKQEFKRNVVGATLYGPFGLASAFLLFQTYRHSFFPDNPLEIIQMDGSSIAGLAAITSLLTTIAAVPPVRLFQGFRNTIQGFRNTSDEMLWNKYFPVMSTNTDAKSTIDEKDLEKYRLAKVGNNIAIVLPETRGAYEVVVHEGSDHADAPRRDRPDLHHVWERAWEKWREEPSLLANLPSARLIFPRPSAAIPR